MNQFSDFLKKNLAQNRSKLVLAVLIDFFRDSRPDLQNQCFLHQSNLQQVERDFSSGVINRQEAWQSLAKLKMGLIHLIDELPGLSFDESAALDHAHALAANFPEPEFDIPVKRSGAWGWVAGIIAAAVVAAGLVYWSLRPEPVVREPATGTPVVHMTLADTLELVKAYRKEADNWTLQNQLDKALESANQAIALRQNDAELYNLRADILFKKGLYTQARGDAERAITLNPNDCWSYITMAQIQTKLGNTERFYENIEKAMQKHCDVWEYDQQPGLLEHRTEPRYQRLVKAYR